MKRRRASRRMCPTSIGTTAPPNRSRNGHFAAYDDRSSARRPSRLLCRAAAQGWGGGASRWQYPRPNLRPLRGGGEPFMTPLLSVSGLRTVFRTSNGDVAAVDGVDISVDRGRTLGIVGESGCG